MKLIQSSLVLLMLAIISCKSSEAKINVPEIVKTKFSTMYPAAVHPEWEMENGKYEASFKENKQDLSAIFSPDGSLFQTEMEMNADQLIQPIKDYVAANFENQKISSAAKITDAQGMVTYEAKVKDADYIFDASGNFMMKESEEGENGEDKE